jgi:hypothetical protein
MATVVSFTGYTPVARYDGIPWTSVQIEEGAENDEDGTWTLIDTQALSPVDADPTNPASRSFTTLGTEFGMWYRARFFDSNGDSGEYTDPVQNIEDDTDAVPYATVLELARILKIRNPTSEQEDAMTRVLTAAALEIDSELGRAGSFGEPYPALVVEVNLERAVEHWRQMESPFGLIGLGADVPAERTAQDSWNRHANKLAPLKDEWGLA